MKKLMVVLAAMLMVGCAVDTETVRIIKGADGQDGVSCTLLEVENGVTVSCSDESSFTIHNGTNGQNGENGSDGQSCSVEQTEEGALITCGESTATVLNGEDGENGSGAIINSYSSSSCTLIAGSTSYTKPTGSGNRGLYSASNCASNTKYAEVSQGEAYWVSNNMLATLADDGSLKVIVF